MPDYDDYLSQERSNQEQRSQERSANVVNDAMLWQETQRLAQWAVGKLLNAGIPPTPIVEKWTVAQKKKFWSSKPASTEHQRAFGEGWRLAGTSITIGDGEKIPLKYEVVFLYLLRDGRLVQSIGESGEIILDSYKPWPASDRIAQQWDDIASWFYIHRSVYLNGTATVSTYFDELPRTKEYSELLEETRKAFAKAVADAELEYCRTRR